MPTQAQSYQRCPLAPAPADSRCQARAGRRPAQPIGADRMPGSGGHPVVAGHRQHVGDLLAFQPFPQRTVIPVCLVGGRPGERHARGGGPADHRLGELRLGGEPGIGGYPGGLAARRVADPRLRQVQLPVDQRVPTGRGVGEVDRDLGVLDLARGAGVLPLHPGRGGPLLDIPGLIHHQDRAGVPQVLDDVIPHVITYPVGIPAGPLQQVLHPIRGRLPGLHGQRPAVLARQPGQQPEHERPRPPPRLHPAETRPDAQHELIDQAQPARRIYAVGSGHCTIVKVQHKPDDQAVAALHPAPPRIMVMLPACPPAPPPRRMR